MVDPDEIANMFHCFRSGARGGVADGAFPIADADDPAGRRDTSNFLVGEVAIDVAGGLHTAMTGDHRAGRHGKDLRNALVAAMRDIDDHAHRFHPLDGFAAHIGQPALLEAMHRTGQFIVEEMREPRHAHSSSV